MPPGTVCNAGVVGLRGNAVSSRGAARVGVVSAVLTAGALLSGCLGSSPTYGTGVSSDKQLLEDVTGLIAIAPKAKPRIDYKPRPELVKTADGSALPEPQDDIVTASAGSSQWPESPEERRARLRAEATKNRDETNFRPDIRTGETDPDAPKITSAAMLEGPGYAFNQPVENSKAQEEYRKRKAISQQGNPTERRYLSEPPTAYRVPVESAPVGELGEPEEKKQRRLRAESRKKSGKTSWRDLVPWL